MGGEREGGGERLGRALGLAPPFAALTIGWAVWAVLLASALSSAALIRFRGTQALFLLTQDAPLLLLAIVLTFAVGWIPAAWAQRLSSWRFGAGRAPPLALAGLVLIVGLLGSRLVFQGYLLSLDEFLADFDARIFASGHLTAPIPGPWRPFAPALQPIYMLPVPSHDMWASAYLPVHAALRALAHRVGAAPWLNPVLSAFSVVAVWGVARRLWPAQPGMAVGAAALLATSSQLLVTGMTGYAMPAHLAFNLAWLWLFLLGGRLGHVGALAMGFLATGLHQMLFHPLFAAPFVVQLWVERRWRLAGVYTLAYAAICGFWIEFFRLELGWMGEASKAAASAGGGWLFERASAALANVKPGNVSALALSLVRFAAWQNPLAPPLIVLGTGAALRAKGHLRSLVLGAALTLFVTALVVPSQTQGWGYRYLHGLLGSISLVAAWAWGRLTFPLAAPERAAANGAFAAACAASLLLQTSLHAWQVWTYVRPYAAANAMVQAAREPVVVIDNNRPWFDMGVVVRNDPFLIAGPKVMLLAALDEPQVRLLCGRGPVAVFDGAQALALGADTVEAPPDPNAVRLRGVMAQLKCGRPLIRRIAGNPER
ncbi:MAG TPA: hypothetical protein VFE13_11145 [Caulobacteraceae bacterium]|jgi:hypothetical protein|nr:hypothetical protein [Caulobacteraceae bacterium]